MSSGQLLVLHNTVVDGIVMVSHTIASSVGVITAIIGLILGTAIVTMILRALLSMGGGFTNKSKNLW